MFITIRNNNNNVIINKLNLILLYILIIFANNYVNTFDNIKQTTIQITKDNINNYLVQEKNTFIMYYAPWCGHCKGLFPVWNKLALKYNDEDKVTIGKVDCSSQVELCSDHDILSYPTLIFYKSYTNINFGGIRYTSTNRDYDSIDKFIINQLDASYVNKQDIDTEESLNQQNDVDLHSLDEKTFQSFINTGYHFVKFYTTWCSHCIHLAPIWKELAEKYRHSKVKISQVDCTENTNLCKQLNVKGYPTMAFYHDGKLIRGYTDTRTVEKFSEFIEELLIELEGSDSGGDDDDDDNDNDLPVGVVIDLNNNNFKTVLDSDVDYIFIKFFAPWCIHCQRLEPTWNSLALKVKSHSEHVRIARVDCTANQDICINYNINGYPTLILFKNGVRVKDYTGSRELDSLYNFLIGYIEHDEL